MTAVEIMVEVVIGEISLCGPILRFESELATLDDYPH